MEKISKSDIVAFLKQQVSLECGVAVSDICVDDEFVTYHMDSLKAVFIMDRLEKFVNLELSPLFFYDHPTIDGLATYIHSLHAKS